MKCLPIDERGFPVPWFVAFIDGKPDFRIIRPGGITRALNGQTCWLCGQPLGAYRAFVIGPMCTVNRVTSEPPSHLECAHFAVQACPFMLNPSMRRSQREKPPETIGPVGIHLDRNPGAMCIWITKVGRFRPEQVGHGVLISLHGEPVRVEWWARGRLATRAEVELSISGGLPELKRMAAMDGPDAERELALLYMAAMHRLPVAA
jgi:hypothetical protein